MFIVDTCDKPNMKPFGVENKIMIARISYLHKFRFYWLVIDHNLQMRQDIISLCDLRV